MSGANGNGIGVTSWGWLDEDGRPPTDADSAAYRLWTVTTDEGRVGFLALPVDVDAVEALIVADRGFRGKETG